MKKKLAMLLLVLYTGMFGVFAEPAVSPSPSATPAPSQQPSASPMASPSAVPTQTPSAPAVQPDSAQTSKPEEAAAQPAQKSNPEATPAPAQDYSGNRTITILHTSDIHGNFQRSKENGTLGYSGIDAIRRSIPGSILVDSGDYLTSNLFMAQNTVENVLALMNAAEYYIAGVGEMDLENGDTALKDVQARAGFHMLSTNVVTSKERTPLLSGTQLVEVKGIKIGFFSILNPDLRLSLDLDAVGDVILEDASKIAQNSVNELKKQGADVIIALSHIGNNEGVTVDQIAAFVSGIDFILDGHDHVEEQGRFIGDTLILNPGANGKKLMQLDLNFGGSKTLTGFSTTVWSYQATENLAMNEEIVALENRIVSEQSAFLNERIALSKVELPYSDSIRYQSEPLGNFIADAYRQKTMAAVAIVNAGSIAGGIPKGDIAKATVLSVLPTGHTVQVKKVTPKVLKGALENGLATLKLNEDGTIDTTSGDAKFPQISGLHVDVNLNNAPGRRVIKMRLENGVSLNLTDDKSTVTVAANSGMFAGENDYDILVPPELLGDYASEGLALVDYLNLSEEYEDYSESRIEMTDKQESYAGLLLTALIVFLVILAILVLVIKLMTRVA